MGSDSNGNGAVTKCGMLELIIFVAAIVTGTACSICSKTMMELHAVGIHGELELFEKPIFQTFGMFIGMTFGLVMHWTVLRFSIPFPGYKHEADDATDKSDPKSSHNYATEQTSLLTKRQKFFERQPSSMPETPQWMFYFLAVPAFFDLGATALCMLGRKYQTTVVAGELECVNGKPVKDSGRTVSFMFVPSLLSQSATLMSAFTSCSADPGLSLWHS